MDSEIFSQLVVTTDSTMLLLLRMCTVVMAMLCTEHTVRIFLPKSLLLALVLQVANVGVRRPGYEARLQLSAVINTPSRPHLQLHDLLPSKSQVHGTILHFVMTVHALLLAACSVHTEWWQAWKV